MSQGVVARYHYWWKSLIAVLLSSKSREIFLWNFLLYHPTAAGSVHQSCSQRDQLNQKDPIEVWAGPPLWFVSRRGQQGAEPQRWKVMLLLPTTPNPNKDSFAKINHIMIGSRWEEGEAEAKHEEKSMVMEQQIVLAAMLVFHTSNLSCSEFDVSVLQSLIALAIIIT